MFSNICGNKLWFSSILMLLCSFPDKIESKDNLQFWSPETTSQASFEYNENRKSFFSKTNDNSTSNESTNDESILSEEIEESRRSKYQNKPDFAIKAKGFIKKLRHKNYTGTMRSKNKIEKYQKRPHHYPQTSMDGLSDPKPRRFSLRKGRSRSYNKHAKYTRITPMYLMQQNDEKPKPENEIDSDCGSSCDFKLNVYSLLNYLKKIIQKVDANVTHEIIGRTIEFKDIILLKFTQTNKLSETYFRASDVKYADEVPEKKIIFIVHGLNAKGMQGIPYLSNSQDLSTLLSYYLEHIDKFDIFLIPVANPDGYDKDSIKNNSPQMACPGVSLDRNFDVAWNSTKHMNSCSRQYPGPSAFSEPETKAIKDVFHRYSNKIFAYFNVHCGSFRELVYKGDAVLYPKGYTEVTMTDDDKYIDLRGEIEEAMTNASFHTVKVEVETLFNWYGLVSGTSVDYASSIYGIPYAMELVMQTYKDGYDDTALEEIWKRVINVIFQHLWNRISNNDVRRLGVV